jgi:FMN phosphatase YigB (HAD superfamily)
MSTEVYPTAPDFYKLHPRVYQLAVDRLGIPAAAIAYQCSNALRDCWC